MDSYRDPRETHGTMAALGRSATMNPTVVGFGGASEGMLSLFQFCCPWLAPAPPTKEQRAWLRR